MSLSSKIALVTGAAQGLGKAITEQLLKNGASVAIMDLKEEEGEATRKSLEETYGEGRVAFFAGSVTSKEDFEGVFKATKDRFGGLDIVINNAGVGGEAPGLWERTVAINVGGTFRGTLLAIDYLRKDKGGRGGVIVNVASIAGVNPNPCSPTYCATKSAIIQYSLSWAKHPELISNGVRINCLAPAFVDTPLLDVLSQDGYAMLPDLAQKVVTAAGTMTSEFVAETTMELIDETEARNGEVLKISKNGGKTY